MSKDPSLSPIEKLTYEKYHEIVLDLLKEDKRTKDLVSFVRPEHTQSIFDDPTQKIYPARTTVNAVADLARAVKRIETSATLSGFIIPGCDIPQTRGDATNIQGWRPNMVVTQMNGQKLNKPKVLGLSVWGHHVPLWHERDVQAKDQTRVALPFFRPVTVVAEEGEFESRKYPNQKFKGWTLLYLKTVQSTDPISISNLVNLLKISENLVTVDDLNENMVFSTVVLHGKWLHTESIDHWVDDPDNFDKVEKKGPDGQPLMRRDAASGRMVPVVEVRAKRKKSITGQPMLQEIIGLEEGESVETVTMKISVGPIGDTETSNRANVEFQNYRFGRPELMIFGLQPVIQNAMLRGNLMDPDPTKNPYEVLNSSYRGTEIICVCNFARHAPYTSGGETTYYITLIAGFVIYADAGALSPTDTPIPPMPELPEVLFSGEPSKPLPKPIAESQKDSVVIVRDEEEEEEDEEEEVELTREEELDEMSTTELKNVLKGYREDGHDISLRGKRSGLLKQILDIESGKIVAAKTAIEAHAKEAEAEKDVKIPGKVESDEEEVAKAKAKLLAKRKAQAEQGKEIRDKSTDLSDDQLKQLEDRLRKTIADVGGPEMDFEEMWGEDNDLGAFPEWVTVHHKDLVDTMLKRLYKESE